MGQRGGYNGGSTILTLRGQPIAADSARIDAQGESVRKATLARWAARIARDYVAAGRDPVIPAEMQSDVTKAGGLKQWIERILGDEASKPQPIYKTVPKAPKPPRGRSAPKGTKAPKKRKIAIYINGPADHRALDEALSKMGQWTRKARLVLIRADDEGAIALIARHFKAATFQAVSKYEFEQRARELHLDGGLIIHGAKVEFVRRSPVGRLRIFDRISRLSPPRAAAPGKINRRGRRPVEVDGG